MYPNPLLAWLKCCSVGQVHTPIPYPHEYAEQGDALEELVCLTMLLEMWWVGVLAKSSELPVDFIITNPCYRLIIKCWKRLRAQSCPA